MATYIPLHKSIDSIIDWFQECECINFRAGQGSTKLLQNIETGYFGNDENEALQKLTSFLQRVDQSENYSPFRIEVGEVSKGKFNVLYSTVFQLNQPKRSENFGSGYHELIAKMNALEQRLAMQEIEEEEEEEEEETGIGSILNSPQMKNVLMNVVANFLTPKQPVAVAGVPDETDKTNLLQEALQILKKNDPELEMDLYKLATISEQQPDFFKMLIGMLRKQ
jgi:hypothetical protein